MANFNTAVAQEQLIGYWLTTKGISKKTLETHPQIDDIILMLNIRHSSDWSNFNKSEEAVWGAGDSFTKAKIHSLLKALRN